MAQFDVYRFDGGLVLDCQTDLLDLKSRLVIPLVSPDEWPPAGRLNPVFVVAGEECVMLTQAALSVRVSDLGAVVASLQDRDSEIRAALDMLINGF